MGLTSSQTRLIVLSLLVLAAAVGSLRVPHPAVASAETDPAPPNVVVILTDDMRTDEMAALRKTNDLLVAHGTTFTHAIAPTSLGCPARAALLTGTYSHTNN